MTTLSISVTSDFSASNALHNVDVIQFQPAPRSSIVATFLASQFDGIQISDLPTIRAGLGLDRLVINEAHDLQMSGWSFVNWTILDHITVNGTDQGDGITGTSQSETVDSGAGNDAVIASLGSDITHLGDGDDSFIVQSAADIIGDVLDGGVGLADSIVITTAEQVRLNTSTLSGIEDLVFFTSGSATLTGDQIGAVGDRIHKVSGGAGVNVLDIHGPAIDLTNVKITAWTPQDRLALIGTTGNDLIRGSTRNDDLSTDHGGADTLIGNGGNDLLRVLENTNGSVVDGGAGRRDAVLVVGDHDFRLDTFRDVEVLKIFPSGASVVTLGADQIGGSAALTKVQGNSTSAHLTITGSDTNLAGVKFSLWGSGNTITLQGTAGADSLSASAQDDKVLGDGGGDKLISGNGSDTLDGGAGNDILIGGAGQDLMIGGADSDRFVFAKGADSLINAPDVIADFQSGIDQIVLTGIDADTTTAATNDRFTFIASLDFTHHAGELRILDQGVNVFLVQADRDGDGVQDFAIQINGTAVLVETDFIL